RLLSLISSFFLSFLLFVLLFFFFNDPATTEIYTLSLHDALPIEVADVMRRVARRVLDVEHPVADGQPFAALQDLQRRCGHGQHLDRKSTRLNSSHVENSYAGFCLEKKKKQNKFKQYDQKKTK